jgi:hypothetical protein
VEKGMTGRSKSWWILLGALLMVGPLVARGQTDAGTVVAVQGKAQLQRRGTWQEATIGLGTRVGDRIRTGASDRARIVFRDDSTLDIGPATEFVLDEQIFDTAAHKVQSSLRLFYGKLRASVSSVYHESRARYEIETPTAVAGVRGTEFIIAFNPADDVTEIFGIAEDVQVVGKTSVMGGGAVRVGPQMLTQIKKGGLPSAPTKLTDQAARVYYDGVSMIGTGKRDGLNVLHPILAGRLISDKDVPGAPGEGEPGAEAAGLGTSPPDQLLANRLSRDVYTNSQPLRVYEALPPGQPPSGTVIVDF